MCDRKREIKFVIQSTRSAQKSPRNPRFALFVEMTCVGFLLAVAISPTVRLMAPVPVPVAVNTMAPQRTVPPRAQFTGGLTERSLRRLSQMKTAEEPLDEEITGLGILGACIGMVAGGPLFGSPIFGIILGSQIGPLLAFKSGPTGEKLRAAGWEGHVLWRSTEQRAQKSWAIMVRESEARGITAALRQVWRRAVAVDGATGMSRRLKVLATAMRAAGMRAWQAVCRRSRESGLTARLASLWRRTGLPALIEEERSRRVLNARMRGVSTREQRENGGGNDGFGFGRSGSGFGPGPL